MLLRDFPFCRKRSVHIDTSDQDRWLCMDRNIGQCCHHTSWTWNNRDLTRIQQVLVDNFQAIYISRNIREFWSRNADYLDNQRRGSRLELVIGILQARTRYQQVELDMNTCTIQEGLYNLLQVRKEGFL